MGRIDLDKVVFYKIGDDVCADNIENSEHVLRVEIKSLYTDINEVLELYNLKNCIDNKYYLKSWTENDISDFKQRAKIYSKIIQSQNNRLIYVF